MTWTRRRESPALGVRSASIGLLECHPRPLTETLCLPRHGREDGGPERRGGSPGSRDAMVLFQALVGQLDQEREKRWKAEQAEKKLKGYVDELHRRAEEEKGAQSLALLTADRWAPAQSWAPAVRPALHRGGLSRSGCAVLARCINRTEAAGSGPRRCGYQTGE